MNNFELCKAICNLSSNIDEAKILDKAKLVAMYSKPKKPIPDEKIFTRLFFQLDVIAGIMVGNSDFFGQPLYFTQHYQNVDLYFFHLSRFKMQGILGVHVSGQHEHEKIVSKVTALLESQTKEQQI